MIRIVLVEDHFLARLALRSILDARTDMAVMAESRDGVGVADLCRKHQAQVLILDLRLPGKSGFEVLAEVRKALPSVKVVVLTNYDGSEDVYKALHGGALAYLLKDTSGEDLVNAIQSVAQGLRYLPASVGRRLAERLGSSELTARELEVLHLIARGMAGKEIADALGIAEKTVRIHTSNLLEKMGVGDRTQAAIAAIQRGMVHLD